jgi:enediyne biosynthesis protein E4
VAVGDYDNDGWLDLFVTHFSEDYSTLYRNRGGQFQDVTYEAGLGTVNYRNLSWGTGFFDFDNDGWKELFVANGHIYPQADQAGNRYRQQNTLFRNLRNGRFALIPQEESGLSDARSSRGAAFADLANKGNIEMVVNNIDDSPFLYGAGKIPRGNWVRFSLIGTRCNRDAIGARVFITAAGLKQIEEIRSADSFLSCSDARIHFGLGEASVVDQVEINWPDGTQQRHGRLAANCEYRIRQGDDHAVPRT